MIWEQMQHWMMRPWRFPAEFNWKWQRSATLWMVLMMMMICENTDDDDDNKNNDDDDDDGDGDIDNEDPKVELLPKLTYQYQRFVCFSFMTQSRLIPDSARLPPFWLSPPCKPPPPPPLSPLHPPYLLPRKEVVFQSVNFSSEPRVKSFSPMWRM